MAFENASHIDELVASSPTTTDDPFGANAIYLELQQLKTVLTTDFANVSGAVTASDVEMNYLDITTLGTAQTSKALTISATDTWNVAGMTCANLGTITTVDINGGTWAGTIDGNWTAAGQTCADLGTVTTCDINGGTLDGVTISGSTINGAVGGGTPAAGAFTTLTASGAVTFTSGTLNGIAIGGSTPAAGAFTTLTASGAVTFTSGTINGTTVGASTPAAGTFTNALATSQIGYTTGAGGTVTQITSRTTGVTINKTCGSIQLVSAAGSTSFANFTVTNSTVAATDTIHICQKSGTDRYRIHVTNVANGSFVVSFATITGTTSETPVFNFAVIKGVTS